MLAVGIDSHIIAATASEASTEVGEGGGGDSQLFWGGDARRTSLIGARGKNSIQCGLPTF